MDRFTGLIGLAVILGVAYLASNNRKAIKPRVLLWGMGLQLAFAFLVLDTPLAQVFTTVSTGVNHLLEYSAEGSKFVFGDKLGAQNDQFGVVFAFQVLPIVIFIASLFAILYYVGLMQILVRAMAVIMQKVMGTSGAESTNVAASTAAMITWTRIGKYSSVYVCGMVHRFTACPSPDSGNGHTTLAPRFRL